MFCKNCGSALTENDQFCKNCGAAVNAQNNIMQQPTMTSQPMPQQATTPEMSTIQQPSAQPNENTMTGPMMNPVSAPSQNMMGDTSNNLMQQQPTMTSQPLSSMQQPMTGQVNVSAPQNPKEKKKSSPVVAIVAVIAVIVLAAIYLITTGKINLSGGGTDKDISPNGGEIAVNENKTYTVKFKGFTFKIPSNIIYEVDNDQMLIIDEDETWANYIEVIGGSYTQISANKDKLKPTMQKAGYEVGTVEERNIGGQSFVIAELSKGGQNAIISYTKANAMYIFGNTTLSSNNDFDYDALAIVQGILNSAEYSDESNSIANFEMPDLYSIATELE